ncbi:hypothetical protein KKF84_08270, partial [Myxococcota bacterium]|nr:hypothetical protein [Myxococcota bacterium]
MGISLFSKAGTFLITGTAMILFLVLATQTSPAKGVISVARFASFIMSSLARGATALGKAIVALFAWENAEGQPPEETQLSSADGSLDTVADEASPLPASQSEINDASEGATESLITEVPGDDAPLESSSPADEITSEDPAGAESAAIPGKGRGKKARGTNTKPMPRQPVSVDPVKAASAARTTKPPVTEPAKSAQNQAPVASPAPTGTVAPAMATIGPRILNMEESDESRLATLKEFRDELGEFVLPDPEILHYEKTQGTGMDPETMINLSSRMVSALADYKISGSVTEIHPGPVVTMYEFVPEAGIRVSKIESLNKDLALSLAATRVRIVAPIPGKSAVGIEVPNKRRQTVYIKEGIADTAFQESKSKLTMVLGKDIKGKNICCDLAKAPHLLVAGATGSGKSVGVNTMIMSILYRATPRDVRFIMIDPKMVELSIYNDIPHLLLPVVTDPQKANLALQWAVKEMERRYQLLSDLKVRNLGDYNTRVEELVECGIEETPEHLPAIVVVIDEFADLMMVAAKDVEIAVARIAQKARAVGIHLILATQRPSTDV